MGAEPGRRSLKMPAEKLGPVIVDVKLYKHFLPMNPESHDIAFRLFWPFFQFF